MFKSLLEDRTVGCIVGAGVGDALGTATEEFTVAQIKKRYGGWVEGIVEPFYENWRTAIPLKPYHTGDGLISDDTLVTHALIRSYLAKNDHLDAYDLEQYFLPELTKVTWVPELEAEVPMVQRLWYAEKWLVQRLQFGNVDPREAGVGNIVNCGASMYISPVGVMNAANPHAAYEEAITITGAHQSSYGREAAGVLAACVAAALMPNATVESVIETALSVAKDGTKSAIEAVCTAAHTCKTWKDAVTVLREAVAPFDSVGEDYNNPARDARRPSRLHAIEELPIALGFLVVGNGAYKETVLGCVNYGRDSDSIASMAGALVGALGGVKAIPKDWHHEVERASRIDLVKPALELAALSEKVFHRDFERLQAHKSAITELTSRS